MYIPVKRFEDFVQSAVNARRQGDENSNPTVLGETMMLLAKSSFGYQTKDRSRHSITKHTNYENTHAATNRRMFDGLGYISDQLHEVELATRPELTTHRSFFTSDCSSFRFFFYFFMAATTRHRWHHVSQSTDSQARAPKTAFYLAKKFMLKKTSSFDIEVVPFYLYVLSKRYYIKMILGKKQPY